MNAAVSVDAQAIDAVAVGSPSFAGRLAQFIEENGRVLGIGAVLVAVVGLSTGSTMIKSTGAAGATVAFWRLAFGAVIWQVILAVRRTPMSVAAWRATLPCGLLFGLNLTAFFTGVTHTRISHAEFIGTLGPLIVVPIAAYHLRERVKPVIGVLGALALGGVSLIIFQSSKGGKQGWLGDSMIAGAMLLWSAYLFASKHARRGFGTSVFMAGMTASAALTVLPFALATHRFTDVHMKGWVLIVIMSIVSGVVGHGLLAWAQRHIPLSTMSLLQLGQPALGTTWAWVFLHETVKPMQMVGMAIVLVSVSAIARVSTRTR